MHVSIEKARDVSKGLCTQASRLEMGLERGLLPIVTKTSSKSGNLTCNLEVSGRAFGIVSIWEGVRIQVQCPGRNKCI